MLFGGFRAWRIGSSRREGHHTSLPRWSSWLDKSDTLIFIGGTVLILGFALLIIQQEYRTTLDLWKTRLSAAVVHRAWTFRSSLQQSQDDAQVLAGFIATRELLNAQSNSKDLVFNLFNDFREVYEYSALCLFDSQQRNVVHVTAKSSPLSKVTASAEFRQVVQSSLDTANFQVKLVRGPDQTPLLVFATPVFAAPAPLSHTPPIGAVAMFDPFSQELLPLLTIKDLPMKTLEAPLLQLHNAESRSVSPRYVTDPAASATTSATDTLRTASITAVEERATFGEFVDFRNVAVMAAMQKIAAIDSVLVVKVNSDEALADFHRTASLEASFALALVLAYAGVILVFRAKAAARRMQSKLRQEHLVNERLETTVSERTKQLAFMNQQLSIELRERERAEKETRELNAELELRVLNRTAELESANKELSAFAYSVSHDLRAPLRGIDGWSTALLEDYSNQLDPTGQQYLTRVLSETHRMGNLIDDMLLLSRLSRDEMNFHPVDLSALAHNITSTLRDANPHRSMQFIIAPNLQVTGDARLLDLALTNLFSNAVKFTSQRPAAIIEFASIQQEGTTAFFIRDNGAGFDMKYASTLFGAFQRLHNDSEFPGTGIGLAIVQRVITRHGGRVWAEARENQGATFWFTLGDASHE